MTDHGPSQFHGYVVRRHGKEKGTEMSEKRRGYTREFEFDAVRLQETNVKSGHDSYVFPISGSYREKWQKNSRNLVPAAKGETGIVTPTTENLNLEEQGVVFAHLWSVVKRLAWWAYNERLT